MQRNAGAGLIPESEKKANRSITDDFVNPTTNEGNLLSLLTLRSMYNDNDQAKAAIKGMAAEEGRHLLQAMSILTGDMSGAGGEEAKITQAAAEKLRDKFGRDMTGAIKLANMLKDKADAKETELILAPFVDSVVAQKSGARAKRSGFQRDAHGIKSGTRWAPINLS